MDRTERPSPKDRVQVIPEPTRPDLFAFIERLFEGSDQKPERIELRQAYGHGARKYSQSVILQKEFKTNLPKPTREQMVAMSNEFLDVAQENCNSLGKAHRYGVLAKHHAKSDSWYGVHLLALRPKQDAHYDPTAGDGEDEELQSDAHRRDALLQYGLDHLRQADENERWRQDQFSTATGDILERYQQINSQLMQWTMEMMKEHRELFKTADEALSRKTEREMAQEKQRFHHQMMSDGLQFLRQLAPVAVNQLTGKKTIPTPESPESIAVKTFLEGLSERQAQLLFGDVDPEKNVLQPNGIFTPAQAIIFSDVATCAQPPEALDLLLEGEHAVTETQIAKAQGVISANQFMPLVALVVTKKRQQIAMQPKPNGTP